MNPARQTNRYSRLNFGLFCLRIQPRRLVICSALAAMLVFLVFVALVSGSGRAGFAEVLAFLSGSDNEPARSLSIIGDLRFPRIVMALACGAMLGLSGAALQTLTRNGLADPGLLGVREGASLAVISLMIAFPQAPVAARPLIGMAGGLTVALAAAAIAGSLSRLRFILIGIGFSWLLSAVITMILTTADIDRVQTAMTWMAGSLAATTPDMLPVALICLVIGGTLLFATARAADTALLGDTAAIGLGVRLQSLSALRLAAPILLTAAAVSCVGSLGFVGLIAPHLARLMIGGGQIALLTGSSLIGAGLVLMADTLGRSLFAPLQIPAGIILAMIGVPALLLLLWRRRDQL
jgi:iron complex transport system permease protein